MYRSHYVKFPDKESGFEYPVTIAESLDPSTNTYYTSITISVRHFPTCKIKQAAFFKIKGKSMEYIKSKFRNIKDVIKFTLERSKIEYQKCK